MYVTVGRSAPQARMQPTFMMTGASRCGTTTLFNALSAHPHVLRPAYNKGIYYFDLNSYRPFSWYLAHFPVARWAHLRAPTGIDPVTFEASGYYLHHPMAFGRIAQRYPSMKFIVMVRDPVERAFSAYKHEHARGFDNASTFEEALDLEPGRLEGEVERLVKDPTYESRAHRHQSYVDRGHYVDQLERLVANFSREQLHVIQSERFFEAPREEYAKALEFLGLPNFDYLDFKQDNARPSSPMKDSTRLRLTEHFEPYDHRLARLLGEPLAWRQ